MSVPREDFCLLFLEAFNFRSRPQLLLYILLDEGKVKILWRIDPLLSGDCVNNDRFWATVLR
jgi:hypothetical protein